MRWISIENRVSRSWKNIEILKMRSVTRSYYFFYLKIASNQADDTDKSSTMILVVSTTHNQIIVMFILDFAEKETKISNTNVNFDKLKLSVKPMA